MDSTEVVKMVCFADFMNLSDFIPQRMAATEFFRFGSLP